MADREVYRPAVAADRAAVLAIHDDVFEGFDYLPSMYNWYITNKDVVCDVAEVNGKVVTFHFNYVMEGGTHCVSGGGRTTPSFQRLGINGRLAKFGEERTKIKFPNLRYVTWASNFQRSADLIKQGARKEERIIRTMRFIVYKTSNSELRSLCEYQQRPEEVILTAQQTYDILLSAPNRAKLFPDDIIKWGPSWIFTRPTDKAIKKAVESCHVILTKKQNGDILAVSFGGSCLVPKAAFRYDVDVFVESGTTSSAMDMTCLAHSIMHMKHAVQLSNPGQKVGMFLSLPESCNSEVVKSALKPHLGDRCKSDFFSGECSFMFESKVSADTQAKL